MNDLERRKRVAEERRERYAELKAAGLEPRAAAVASTSRVKFLAALAAIGRSHGSNAAAE